MRYLLFIFFTSFSLIAQNNPLYLDSVGCDGVGQLEAALNGVASQHLFTDEVALAMRCAPAGTGDVVGVGGAFDEVVKTRVPHLAKVGRDGGQSDAQIVDVVAHEIKPAPERILTGTQMTCRMLMMETRRSVLRTANSSLTFSCGSTMLFLVQEVMCIQRILPR